MVFCSFLLTATLFLPVFIISFNLVGFSEHIGDDLRHGSDVFYFLLVCEEFPFIIFKQIIFRVLDLPYVGHVFEEKEN